MKTFRGFLNEEIKLGSLSCGGIDIERDAVRDEINGILAGIASKPSVTPYNSLIKIRKALSYFSIFLPKKVYLEGRHGVEVWEVNQFGDKMGVTDQGEWINHVPAKYFLFFHYHLIGSMYFLESKIVDEKELEEKLNRIESMVAEEADAAARQNVAKAMAPKEEPHTALGDCDCSQGDSPSTKSAVSTMMRKTDKKLAAGELDEAMTRKQKDMAVRRFMSHDPDAGERILAMGKKEREEKKSFASAKKEIKRLKEEEQLDELMGKGKLKHHAFNLSLKAHNEPTWQNLQKAKRARDLRDRAKSKEMKEEQIDEGGMPASVIKHKQKLASMSPEELKQKFAGKSEEHLKSMARRHGYGKDSDVYSKHVTKKLDEKLTKGMSPADVIKDFVHSDDPKFKGKSKKERMKMALGAYYGMHPEKSKRMDEAEAPKKKKMILVTRKGDPHAKTGGGVMRIPKDKYNPKKHNLAVE